MDSHPFPLSTEHLRWVSDAAAPPMLLECSTVDPRTVVLSPACTSESPGELLTLTVLKVHPSAGASEPLGVKPSYQIVNLSR